MVPVPHIAPHPDGIRVLQTLRLADIVQRFHDQIRVQCLELKDHGVFVRRRDRCDILYPHIRRTVRTGFIETAAQSVETVIMKDHIVGCEFTPVGRWHILPVDPFTQVDDMGFGIRKLPTFAQVASPVLETVAPDLGILDRRVQRPIGHHQPFHPGPINTGGFPEIRVEIDNIPASSHRQFTAVLRRTEFIPPPCGIVFHIISFKAGKRSYQRIYQLVDVDCQTKRLNQTG